MRELDFLFKIRQITDILINGPKSVMIDRGKGLEKVRTPQGFIETTNDVRQFALKLASLAKVRLDDAKPICDGVLEGGQRINIVLSPVAQIDSGAVISIRIPSKTGFTLDELVANKTLSFSKAQLLRRAVIKKKNIMIAGATGSGKTSLLSALLWEVPHEERLVCIEEAREISPKVHPGMIFLSAKDANSEGIGRIDLSALVHSAMRMRPDRVIIGECRGNETKEFLEMLNTGHSGSISTIHANSAEDVALRIAVLAQNAGMNFEVSKQLFSQNCEIVVYISRDKNGKRVVSEISN